MPTRQWSILLPGLNVFRSGYTPESPGTLILFNCGTELLVRTPATWLLTFSLRCTEVSKCTGVAFQL